MQVYIFIWACVVNLYVECIVKCHVPPLNYHTEQFYNHKISLILPLVNSLPITPNLQTTTELFHNLYSFTFWRSSPKRVIPDTAFSDWPSSSSHQILRFTHVFAWLESSLFLCSIGYHCADLSLSIYLFTYEGQCHCF